MELSCTSSAGARPRTTTNNERLPYEILGLIFHHYSSDTRQIRTVKPETLLLVCKSWYFAALEHRTLWSCLKIDTFYTSSLPYWQFYTRLRLSRSSPTALFDIDLSISVGVTHMTEGLTSIALILIGTDGCIAKRWRSLYLYNLPDFLSPLFCVPTPSLVNLEFYNLSPHNQSLPETPVLQKFYTTYSQWPYPDLQNITHLTVRGGSSGDIDEEAISKAQKLIKLELTCDDFTGQLRGEFPALEYLHLGNAPAERFLSAFSAPRLKTLSLAHRTRRAYPNTCQCPGIRFQALEELILDLGSLDPYVKRTHFEGVRMLLKAAANIKVLRTTSKFSFEAILDILEDLQMCQENNFTLKYSEYSMKLCQGEARRASIAASRSQIRARSTGNTILL